ncbi:hypothetical protein Mp_1g24480 [Marchantia polymorpha subsp. ruderalis]|uniref:Uncharacterized protein n=2 Tax=Marchantia polymorpha TaxID=3197 RepID=A0AAF6ATU6_MARPO|nr:hypothetical protein MARPO_0061s0073 [Marchantia polymorpha]BBM99866.1 hypothetical protein Mp_1g24480 [Marchantia polymorpha subsp. ruderalis]|eukprot:PTQ36818.1 hypothetical protein MARPO_0061s0073 [Marchantia polymorpha]
MKADLMFILSCHNPGTKSPRCPTVLYTAIVRILEMLEILVLQQLNSMALRDTDSRPRVCLRRAASEICTTGRQFFGSPSFNSPKSSPDFPSGAPHAPPDFSRHISPVRDPRSRCSFWSSSCPHHCIMHDFLCLLLFFPRPPSDTGKSLPLPNPQSPIQSSMKGPDRGEG